MLAFRLLKQTVFATIRKLLIDKTVLGPTTVIGSAYDTYKPGGRLLVQLSNGWLVTGAVNGTTDFRFYVSKDKGVTWGLIGSYPTGATLSLSMTAVGTVVHVVIQGTTKCRYLKFDVLTYPMGTAWANATSDIDTGQTVVGNVSITSHADGTLHACWLSKNATYPTYFNMRYSKSTNGGVSWSTPTQVSTYTTNYAIDMPCIVLRADGTPIVFMGMTGPTSISYIIHYEFNGSTWVQGGSSYVYSLAGYSQARPCAVVTGDGVIHVSWDGIDASSGGSWNVYYSKSTDNGITWSTATKLTTATGGSNHMYHSSIASDKNDNLVILYSGAEASMNNRNNIYMRKWNGATWDTAVRLTNQSTAGLNENYPQAVDNIKDFSLVPFVWTSSGSSKIQYLGSYNEDPAINHQTNAVVVASAYSLFGNGGRKLVRLSNGWLVSAVKDGSNNVLLYVSKNDGNSWTLLASNTGQTASAGFCIGSFGTIVHLITASSGGINLEYTKFDASTITLGATLTKTGNIDTSQTGYFSGSPSIAIAPNGDLHACWSSKNATYPNSFNIRYSKSTNGGVTWSAPAQMTSLLTTGQDFNNPCIFINSSGEAWVVTELIYPSNNSIKSMKAEANATQYFIHNGVSYGQYRPTATVDSIGVIHVSWDGYDATDPSKLNIRYASSADGGVTWSTMLKLTSGNASTQGNTAIEVDASNNVWVLWHGAITGDTVLAIRGIKRTGTTWGAIQNIVSSTASFQAPRICAGFNAFEEPLFVYMEIEGASIKFRGKWNGEYTRFDRSRGVVVDSAYDISGNGGRKIVRLSNGFLVTASASGGIVYFRVSKDSGTSWQQLCYTPSNVYTIYAITSIGTNVYCAITRADGNAINFYAFNATTVPNNQLTNTGNVTTTENGMQGISLTASANGDLHVAYSCKNATYPNSFNIRYSKSTTAGVSWDTPVQLTNANSAGIDKYQPSITITAQGYPHIAFAIFASGAHKIGGELYNGSTWVEYNLDATQQTVFQQNPCITTTSNGRLLVVWSGQDSVESTHYNIRYKYSDDHGVTWSAQLKLTTGNSYSQRVPVVTSDSLNDVYAVWHGGITTDAYYNIRAIKCTSGVWGAIQNITNTTVTQQSPSVCDNYKDFIEPICMWQDNQVPSIKVRGKWYEEVA